MNPETETKTTADEISMEEALKKVTDTITMYIDECKIMTKRSVELNLNACMGMDEDEKNKEGISEICLDLNMKLNKCMDATKCKLNLVIAKKEATDKKA